MNCVLYLNWPERCFAVAKDDVKFFKTLVPKGAKVSVVRNDEEFLKKLPKATHVVTWHFRSEWYALAPNLKLVASPAAGRELIATPSSIPHSSLITTNCPRIHHGGFHGTIISEAVLAFILAWTHGFFQVRSMPLWPRSNLANVVDRDLAGSHAVMLGFGKIGHAIAKRLEAYGVSIRGFTHVECDALRGKAKLPYSALRTLHSALASADWLIAALPSDTGTDDFIDAKLLAKLPAKCVFVNVGRGNCVDETALVNALKGGKLAGAYLDVYKHEPTVLAKPAKLKRGEVDIAAIPAGRCPWNLIRMPHASAYSPSYMKLAFQELKDEGLI